MSTDSGRYGEHHDDRPRVRTPGPSWLDLLFWVACAAAASSCAGWKLWGTP